MQLIWKLIHVPFQLIARGKNIPHTRNNWIYYDFKERKIVPNHYTIILTWPDTGSQNMAISITGKVKDALTILVTIRLTGETLPLYILAKGETIRSEVTQLDGLGDNATDHSPTGWMTVQTIIRHLRWLCELLDDQDREKRIYHVLMDIYPVHIAESVRLQARLLGFDVHFIPSGMTNKYQALDCSIFGCMKSTARPEYLKLICDSPERRITKEHAIQILQTA
jgi:hypothetical protein